MKRLLYESTEEIKEEMIQGYLKGNYRDYMIKQISLNAVSKEKIKEFLQTNTLVKNAKNSVKKEEIQASLENLRQEKRKIFSKIAKNQNTKTTVKTIESKKVYLSSKLKTF
jgi:hypothetical protein